MNKIWEEEKMWCVTDIRIWLLIQLRILNRMELTKIIIKNKKGAWSKGNFDIFKKIKTREEGRGYEIIVFNSKSNDTKDCWRFTNNK